MAAWFVVLAIAVPWLGALCLWALGDERPGLQHSLASAFAVLGGVVSLGLVWVIGAEPVVSISMGSVFGEFSLVPDESRKATLMFTRDLMLRHLIQLSIED